MTTKFAGAKDGRGTDNQASLQPALGKYKTLTTTQVQCLFNRGTFHLASFPCKLDTDKHPHAFIRILHMASMSH
jgi:hypothetical protein